MSVFDRILFPVDFSDRCAHTACYVAQLARKFESAVFLLHVVEPMPMVYPVPLMLSTTAAENDKVTVREARKELDHFRSDAFANIRISHSVEVGDPATVITHFAHVNDMNLIVLPTHGRGLFRRLLLGGITSKVLHDSNCAVLTTAHSLEITPANAEPKQIVCALDLSSDDPGTGNLHLIREASAIAKVFGATVHLVHAVPPIRPTPEFPIDPELIDGLLGDARRCVEKWQAECGTRWEVIVESGEIAPVVRHAALTLHAELVIIGRGKLNQHLGRLRTHVGSLIRESPCPVLSLPEHSN